MNEILSKIFGWNNAPKSGEEAKRRLKLVMAYDRVGMSPEMITAMRKEILEVVGRYLEIDPEETELGLESDNRMTTLTANFPVRSIKRQPSTPE
ncbi:MAG: cell division topological specificity factor MinE [Chlorogloea purpurea SAG 13.99]|nr:cell division topological specificity factor MinE [Chlorogloea purpurea SAG 13.99]